MLVCCALFYSTHLLTTYHYVYSTQLLTTYCYVLFLFVFLRVQA